MKQKLVFKGLETVVQPLIVMRTIKNTPSITTIRAGWGFKLLSSVCSNESLVGGCEAQTWFPSRCASGRRSTNTQCSVFMLSWLC